MGHDLGHTAFGHTGETVLDDILRGRNPHVRLPEAVVRDVGAFKHNYQSVRVVDLLERRYTQPGLNLTDQVREGILKHTRWRTSFPFPLPDREGLLLDAPCHLEGQAVAVGDEIAQQTHDLEDGLRVGSIRLATVERLPVARRVISILGSAWEREDRSWRRQNLIIRGLIRLFVTDAIEASAARLCRYADRYGLGDDRAAWRDRGRDLGQTTIWFSPEVENLFGELKAFIYRRVINHQGVNRQDWRARKVISALFDAFWTNPLTLPDYVLLRARDELEMSYLRDLEFDHVAGEITDRYHASAGFARLVVDHIAGMSDRYALEEYSSLELPTLQQPRGDVQ